ncbi:MAG: hypothetical protein JO267_12770 [Alphaproteobacteria bacterium]|nr:hypothetical protein [Alphaproteobacteria bacterium]
MTTQRLCGFILLGIAALLSIDGCVPQQEAGDTTGRPQLVVVRSLQAAPGSVVVDPSFGFSLYRGAPGVPLRARAASVTRAASFEIADAVTDALRRLGLDAIRSDTVMPDPERRTLVVHGVFLRLDEGHKRRVGERGSRVVAEIRADYSGPGVAPRQALGLRVDSDQLAGSGAGLQQARAGMETADVTADAARVGRVVAAALADLARRQGWVAAAR